MRQAFNEKGMECARYFKYYAQFQKFGIKRPLPIEQVGCRTLYVKYRSVFDRLGEAFEKRGLEVEPFIRYFVQDGKHGEDDVKGLIDRSTFEDYKDFVQLGHKMKNIFGWFMKSVKNVAEESVECGYFTARDFLKAAIDRKLLGNYVAGGRISKYYLAAIPNFDKVVPRLDYFSRCELADLVKYFDVYQVDVNNAMKYVKNVTVNPLDVTNKAIAKIRARKS